MAIWCHQKIFSQYFPKPFFNGSQLWQLPWLLKCHILSPKLCEKKGDSDRAGNSDTSGLYLAGYSWTRTMLDHNFPQSGGFKNLQMSRLQVMKSSSDMHWHALFFTDLRARVCFPASRVCEHFRYHHHIRKSTSLPTQLPNYAKIIIQHSTLSKIWFLLPHTRM